MAALDDESAAELQKAIGDITHSVAAITRAINTLTDVDVSETTVRSWRHGERST